MLSERISTRSADARLNWPPASRRLTRNLAERESLARLPRPRVDSQNGSGQHRQRGDHCAVAADGSPPAVEVNKTHLSFLVVLDEFPAGAYYGP